MTCRLAILAAIASSLIGAAPDKRPFKIEDIDAIAEVSDPQISPDGAWVTYTLKTVDPKKDERTSDLWMMSWDGQESLRLTSSKENEENARFSPDGRRLAFLSNRTSDCETDQLWIMNRAGGEAERYTDLKASISDFVWSPDSTRIAFVAKDPDPECIDPSAGADKKGHKPIVIDRYQFKEDEEGYLDTRRKHIYLLDLATRRLRTLTPGTFNEDLPAWSPDSGRIAFVSKRGPDFDRHDNWDVFTIEARPGAKPVQLTTYDGADSPALPEWDFRPAWSPDGRWIAYVEAGPKELIYYAVKSLAVIPAAGGKSRALLPRLDRTVSNLRWSKDGAFIYFILEDDGQEALARVRLEGGEIERIALGKDRDAMSFEIGPDQKIAVLASGSTEPPEAYALENGSARILTRHNQALLSKIDLAPMEPISFASKDGTEIHGFMMRPPRGDPKRPQKTILRIHGGPALQFDRLFDEQWQTFAAAGWVVVGANPRGSSGRGESFSRPIYAAWGEKDADDVLAAVDHLASRKIADPDRLAIGGWSYGAILTNHVIERDHRFKAALSGCGQANVLAGYGTDMYIREYEMELGPPWQQPDLWIKLSSPFFHADRIVTPTLFLCGDRDFNVPLLNSEQMYQALRSLGVATQLIIYPGEAHELKRPSYLRDRLERYLAWVDKYTRARAASRAGARRD
jgi:dipeptidyl aminopeptidase/acylaminoacyl peptidase